MEKKRWSIEFSMFYYQSQRYASKKWWQFWIKKPKPFTGTKFYQPRKLTPEERMLQNMFGGFQKLPL